MGKDDQFDNFSCIKLQSCHRKLRYAVYSCGIIWGRMTNLTISVVLTCNLVTVSCVMLCTVVELYGEG